MSDIIDNFRDMDKHRKQANEKRRNVNTAKLMDIKAAFHIEQKTPYQYRVEGKVDFFVTSGRFHNLVTGNRGMVTGDLVEFFKMQFDAADAHRRTKPIERTMVDQRQSVHPRDLKPGKKFTLYNVPVTIVRLDPAKPNRRVIITDQSGYQSTCNIDDLKPVKGL